MDASSFKGIKLKVKCDERRRFKCIVRDSADWNGVAWTWSFDVNGLTEVSLPFSKAIPTKFARTLKDVTIDTSQITTVQLVFSKFEYDDKLNPTFKEGPFALQVKSIQLYV